MTADRQREIDVKNLRFYADMFREHEWSTVVIHQSVFEHTLREIADRIEAAAVLRSEAEKSVWLIEGADVYWCGRSVDDFGSNVEEAVRFARQEDAERVLHWIVPEQMRRLCRTVEHIWS